MQSRSTDGSHSPIGLRKELLSFELGGYLGHNLLSVDIGCLDGLSLSLLGILFFYSLQFLLLDVHRCYVHPKNDVFDL